MLRAAHVAWERGWAPATMLRASESLWHSSAPTPAGLGALCGAEAAPGRRGLAGGGALLMGRPFGKQNSSFFVAVRGQRLFSRLGEDVSCLPGTTEAAEVTNAPVRAGLTSPTPPCELAQGHGARVMRVWDRLSGLCWKPLPVPELLAGQQDTGTLAARRAGSVTCGRDTGTLATHQAGCGTCRADGAGWVVGSLRVPKRGLWQGAE